MSWVGDSFIVSYGSLVAVTDQLTENGCVSHECLRVRRRVIDSSASMVRLTLSQVANDSCFEKQTALMYGFISGGLSPAEPECVAELVSMICDLTTTALLPLHLSVAQPRLNFLHTIVT